jgi:hypothetical protein
MQYFKKGLEVVAKNLNSLLCKIKVVICQLMMKIPIAMPTINVLNGLTFPIYSGDRKSASAPTELKKSPLIMMTNKNQNTSKI